MKVDIRTKFTRKLIQDCLFELLKDKPLTKITVKDICLKADINRTTFYRHYKDPFDLMDQIEAELLVSFKQYAKTVMSLDMESALESMFKAIQNNQEIYRILISSNVDRPYIHNMITESYNIFQDSLSKGYPDLSEEQRRWMYFYIAYGSISITLDWMNQGMNESPAKMATYITTLDNAILNSLQRKT